jgi:hypothetical protein
VPAQERLSGGASGWNFLRQVPRAEATSRESDFAIERANDPVDAQDGRIAEARGGGSSGAQAAGATSSGYGAGPVKIVPIFGTSSRR